MKRFFALLLSLAFAGSVTAQAPQPPEVASNSYVLIDLTSNQTLAEREADTPSDPASLTKLMTAYLVFDAIKAKKLALEQTLPVSRRAWDERKGGASLMFIDTTMTPKVDELLRGMIVQSGNDASVALAEAVGGTVDQFVAMMNRQAQAWGLKNTSFKNVTGLTEPGHKSTARDMAVIASHIIRDHPDFYTYYSVKDYKYNNIAQPNRNLLLRRDPTVDGMKTGYTEAAGYCLIASAQREFPNGKRRLLSVVLGTKSMEARASESQKLLNWGFQAFDAIRLFDTGKPMATVPVWKGASNEAKLGAAGAVFVSVPRGEGGTLQTQLERTDPLVAPLAKGQRVGTLKVTTVAGTKVAEVPLVVMEGVEQAGIFGRAWDALRLWIQ
ncbi:D-alanyl-D-alanine carboxypeptidase family protein [Piscinibacter sp.]|uniref:D-alanyl-D-alanine carboxypeptidase family protein n=1 Tax=Piscinibacter sp. TaxID=1903157 RepID=UPI002CA3D72C|nr:D-alanyl-D-alanine carboxypeptidase family protein [Albitalea sp.]HUG23042.1 D-alanyl-D-alanine carboxypeptidase family protein [Albitalea sp.]